MSLRFFNIIPQSTLLKMEAIACRCGGGLQMFRKQTRRAEDGPSGTVIQYKNTCPLYLGELYRDFTTEEIGEHDEEEENKSPGIDGIPAEMWKFIVPE
jgi:hypothetical protein